MGELVNSNVTTERRGMFKGIRFDKRLFVFGLGVGAALLLILGVAEVYLRYFPPDELSLYLGDSSPLSGNYRPDVEFHVNYKSWETFRHDNQQRLQPYLPYLHQTKSPPIWAFFGNSFVQANGMLADQTRATVKDHVIFKLGRNEPLPIRFAQIKLLLEHGLKPERLFVSFMPADIFVLGKFPLESHHVTKQGALTYKPRLPTGPVRPVVEHSSVAFTTWVRAKMHHGNASFSFKQRYGPLDPILRRDIEKLFDSLTKTAKQHNVPVTVILIPEYYQVARGRGFGFQDDMNQLLKQRELDVCDPREAFLNHANPGSLYLPDRHLNPEGNRILLQELLNHLRIGSPSRLAVK